MFTTDGDGPTVKLSNPRLDEVMSVAQNCTCVGVVGFKTWEGGIFGGITWIDQCPKVKDAVTGGELKKNSSSYHFSLSLTPPLLVFVTLLILLVPCS